MPTILPLGILRIHEPFENTNDLFQTHEVAPQLELNLLRVITQLGIEVLAVRTSTHGGAEDRLDNKAVVGLQGSSIGGAEGFREFLRILGDVGREGNAGEFEATGGCVNKVSETQTQ